MRWSQPICEEIFRKKYMIHGEESPEEVLENVANAISSVEKNDKERSKWKKIFHDLLSSGKFLPAGRILSNARLQDKGIRNLNNCFTIEVQDSMGGIFDALKEDALIQRQGGGVGFDLSPLRPKGANISKGGQSSGSISFLKIFNESAKSIHTGGDRRGAHIALMDISHPDIEEFITAKRGEENNALTQFNISVKVTDGFMDKVSKDEDWDLVFDGMVYKTVKAKYLFDLLCKNAFTYNEPGLFFVDTINKYNNAPSEYTINACNPCGEICMAPYQACCLGALNLSSFLQLNQETKKFSFDFEEYKRSIGIAVRFLDNVVSFSDYPIEKTKQMAMEYRRIGLGFTALADTLSLLGHSYDSPDGLIFSEKIADMLRNESYDMSVNLAIEKGVFPRLKKMGSKKLRESNFVKGLPKELQERVCKYGLRNVSLNTIAPTGTISFSLGQNCSSGIEPIFSLSYKRTIRTGNATGEDTKTEIVWDNGWLTYVDLHKEENESLEEASSRLQTALSKDKNNPFKTTFDILPEAHLKMQGMWQKYIDSSISKTMNLPNNFKVEDYGDLIFKAHKAELKGFTTFNPNGAMKGILVADTKENTETQENEIENNKEETPLSRRDAPKRPVELPCDIHTMHYRGEQYLVLVGKLSCSLYEVFATLLTDELAEKIKSYQTGFIYKHGKGQYSLYITDIESNERKQLIKNIGRVFNSTFETIARMVSMSLRHGTPLQFIVDQLGKGKDIQGFERCLARVIKKYIKDGEKSVALCESCKVQLEYREGCLTCPTCGTSKCG